MAWQARGAFAALLLLALGACASPRIHRLTDFEYTSRPADAKVDLFDYEIDSDYDAIAIVDSERYYLRDYLPGYKPDDEDTIAKARHEFARPEHDAAMARMREELMRTTRGLGGDAVHKIRMLSDEVRGLMPDERAPIPGIVRQGYRDAYFLRGEAVKYIDRSPPAAAESTSDETEARE